MHGTTYFLLSRRSVAPEVGEGRRTAHALPPFDRGLSLDQCKEIVLEVKSRVPEGELHTLNPPSPKLASAVSNNHKPPSSAKADEVSRQLDDGEPTANPIADPKESRTKESAAATIAPAKAGVQCR
jgi:hypothetical protein